MKTFKKQILSFILIAASTSLYAQSCWTTSELAQYAQAEFNSETTISVKDALTCKPIKNAEFSLEGNSYKTDTNGLVSLKLKEDDLSKNIPLTIKAQGYITTTQTVLVDLGSLWKKRFLMSKRLDPKSVRFVLSWGKRPNDLDLHLLAKDYHISFRNTKSITNKVKLDRDATRGYGAETITLDKLDSADEYKVLVHNFSHNGSLDKKAEVKVYLDNKLDRVISLPSTNKRCIEVLSIKNNKVNYNSKPSNECRKK